MSPPTQSTRSMNPEFIHRENRIKTKMRAIMSDIRKQQIRDGEPYKRTFDEHFKAGPEPVKHEKTAVLLLQWKDSDMKPSIYHEVDRLGSTFRDKYQFDVHKVSIESEHEKSPKAQLDKALANFKYDLEGPRRLLIIYYAGHGWGGREMTLAASTTQAALHNPKNHVVWQPVEKCLQGYEADILLVFDCCDAGALLNGRSSRHTFEFLGACKEEQKTPKPGDKSFTNAMIWALENLAAEEGGFDTERLRSEILMHPSFRGQSGKRDVVLAPRFGHHGQPLPPHIWIQPLDASRSGGESTGTISPLSAVSMSKDYEWLDFRLWFDRSQNLEDIKKLARIFSKVNSENRLEHGLRSVSFLSKSLDTSTAKRHFWTYAEHMTRTRTIMETQPSVSGSSFMEISEQENREFSEGEPLGHIHACIKLEEPKPNRRLLLTPESKHSDSFSADGSDGEPTDGKHNLKRAWTSEKNIDALEPDLPDSQEDGVRRRSGRKKARNRKIISTILEGVQNL